MKTLPVNLTENETRVLLHLIDTLPIETADKFGFNQSDLCDLFLKIDDIRNDMENIRIDNANKDR